MKSWLHFIKKPEVTTTIVPTPPSEDAVARATSARSFVLQPFWPELLYALNEQREAAAAKLRQGADSWDVDARNLEHWRAVVEITDFVANYPTQVIEGGQE